MDHPSPQCHTPEHGTAGPKPGCPRVVFFANTDWYLYHFRSHLIRGVAGAFGAEIVVICPSGPYAEKLQAEGYTWIPAELRRRSLNPLPDILLAWRLAKVFRDIRPDLLHAFTLKAIFIGTLAARLSGVVRVVNAVTGMGTLFGSRGFGSLLAQRLLAIFFRGFLNRPGVRTIFQNPEDLRLFQQMTGFTQGLRLVPSSGVDTRGFCPPESRVAPPMVLMASRLIRDKGIRHFCEAARTISATLPEVAFWLAGEIDPGNPSSYSQEEMDRMAAEFPMVSFLGHRSDICALLKQAWLAVLPSQAREGLPRFLIEAAASGLPLVGTDIEGIRQVVLDGQNGLRVPAGNSLALAAAIGDILRDEQRRTAMGAESRALALALFDQEKVLASTMAIYAELGFCPQPSCES